MRDWLERFRSADPDRTAYRNSREAVTYGELYRRAAEYAEILRREGTGPVVLYGHKESSMVVSVLACLMAERPYVPVDSSTPAARFETIQRLTASCPVPEGTAYIIFTSGSTGEPKGVPVSRKSLANFIRWFDKILPLADYRNITVLNQAAFSFDLSAADLFYSLGNGHTLAAPERNVMEDLPALFSFIRKNNVRAAVMTPTFMKLCLLNRDFRQENFPLECVFFCGEQLDRKTVVRLFDAFPEIRIINAYGPTEAACAVSSSLITRDVLAENPDLLPAGDIAGAAVEIRLDQDEIILKGASVSSGYLGGIPGGFFTENGICCYRTGDLGEIRNGRLYIRGRKDSQIKYMGYRIETGEIEAVLSRLSGIVNCAVSPKTDAAGTVRYIRAFVITDREEDDIRRELAGILPDYMVPRVIKTDHLPINENGKLDRRRLAEW